MSHGTIAADIFYPDFGGKVSNFTDFAFYRSKKTAVLEKIGYA